ncbi:MAG: hypothetical protein IJ119_03645 [Clostridia bacterium]|nr:hypothetical protein [Clostridia bacterium]
MLVSSVVVEICAHSLVCSIEQNQIGGLTEVYFGLFTDPEEGCQPRARALAIQKMTGNTADLAAIGRRLTGGK